MPQCALLTNNRTLQSTLYDPADYRVNSLYKGGTRAVQHVLAVTSIRWSKTTRRNVVNREDVVMAAVTATITDSIQYDFHEDQHSCRSRLLHGACIVGQLCRFCVVLTSSPSPYTCMSTAALRQPYTQCFGLRFFLEMLHCKTSSYMLFIYHPMQPRKE